LRDDFGGCDAELQVLDVFVWDDVGVGEVEFEEDGGADLRVDGYGRVGDLRALVGGRGPED
jgi:hypothetical protein